MADRFTSEQLQAAIPDLETDQTLDGITDGATIFRDPWGIPHISAGNEHDLFFAQGFATAQDRLFQMDYDRMRCLGRSAEMIG
ncbi:MAG: penicillin acylase family protein, partial [Chloroflexota bacterium]